MIGSSITVPVLHRDASVLVVDKPAGLPVHPDGRGGGPTLQDGLDALRFGLPRRPELAHRLDRDTSGCLVLGRHPRALARLGALFASGAVEKTYWALVEGGPADEGGLIDLPLGPGGRGWTVRPDPTGKPARTEWRVLGRGAGWSWLELRPLTGRTHQLRAHCAAAGWPIRGDRIYGEAAPGAGLMLHARRVLIPFRPGKRSIEAEAPAPAGMAALIAPLDG